MANKTTIPPHRLLYLQLFCRFIYIKFYIIKALKVLPKTKVFYFLLTSPAKFGILELMANVIQKTPKHNPQPFAVCTTLVTVRLNLFNHVLALFRVKFICNLAIRYPVFRWELCKGCM